MTSPPNVDLPPEPSAKPNEAEVQQLPISAAIERTIEDGQQLIAFIAKHGIAELPNELAQAMIDAKFKAASGKWSANDETDFLVNYDKLAHIIYPVTIESINAIVPRQSDHANKYTQAEKTVLWYRAYTFVVMVALLLVQLYWFMGNNLRVNLTQMLDQKSVVQNSINTSNTDNLVLQVGEFDRIDQRADATYQLLKKWNRLLLFRIELTDTLSEYTGERLSLENINTDIDSVLNAEIALVDNGDGPVDHQSEAEEHTYTKKIVYFKNIVAADFFLEAFQGYILPLLYGLLGALIYVLRSLLEEIKTLTYTYDSDIRYRLRVMLGALGGMLVGWFFKPEGVDTLASLSPMAMAFLMGYNVDVLFAGMDRAIDNVRRTLNRRTVEAELPPKPPQSPQPNRPPKPNKT